MFIIIIIIIININNKHTHTHSCTQTHRHTDVGQRFVMREQISSGEEKNKLELRRNTKRKKLNRSKKKEIKLQARKRLQIMGHICTIGSTTGSATASMNQSTATNLQHIDPPRFL